MSKAHVSLFGSFQTTDNNVKDRYHEKICTELKCQDTDKEADAQKNKILNQHNAEMNSTAVAAYLPLETVIYVTSKQVNIQHSTVIRQEHIIL